MTFRSPPPPVFTKDFMARLLCWHIQEQAQGGLDPETAKHLDGLARGDKPGADRTRRLKPGTVLARPTPAAAGYDSTIIGALELSERKWVLAVQLPGVKRHSRHVVEARGDELAAFVERLKARCAVADDGHCGLPVETVNGGVKVGQRGVAKPGHFAAWA